MICVVCTDSVLTVSTNRTTGHLQHKQDMIHLTDDLYIKNQQPEL
jgi:hypothetical protein